MKKVDDDNCLTTLAFCWIKVNNQYLSISYNKEEVKILWMN